MAAFWSDYGAMSPIDWCEPNYVHSPYIAEFWNSLSSAAIFAVGILGLWMARKREPAYTVAFALLALVGLGSIAFHGTLLRSAQASDELPMIICGLAYAYVLATREQRSARLLLIALVSYALVVIVAYFTLKAYFHFFLVAYALIVAYLSVGSWRVAFREDRRPVMKQLFYASVGAYLGGFALLWIPEHVVLACEHPLQGAQLHAIFHLTSSVGSFCWLQLLMQRRSFERT